MEYKKFSEDAIRKAIQIDEENLIQEEKEQENRRFIDFVYKYNICPYCAEEVKMKIPWSSWIPYNAFYFKFLCTNCQWSFTKRGM